MSLSLSRKYLGDRYKHQRGISLLEAAMTVPLLMFIVMFGVDATRYVLTKDRLIDLLKIATSKVYYECQADCQTGDAECSACLNSKVDEIQSSPWVSYSIAGNDLVTSIYRYGGGAPSQRGIGGATARTQYDVARASALQSLYGDNPGIIITEIFYRFPALLPFFSREIYEVIIL